ncbi:MAG TPA: methyltransferase domain-containing protein, partial [Nitrospira sp.]|nr:methyltransferase domain-containing protein [Nitrospira sp.]
MTETAHRRATMPEAASIILETRSLESAHRRLAELLRPGMSVLDVGCGTGAITHGIAEVVRVNGGLTVGIDVNPNLIAAAVENHKSDSRLWYVTGDAYRLPLRRTFDIVTAARVLQWLAEPMRALREMLSVAKDTATLIVLDYNHRKISWMPEPPRSMWTFYESFLSWRQEAGMDNEIADHLEA